MGIGEFFANINTKMEEKYSALLDFLQDKGIPVYNYNDWLETHGIPAMWFSIGLISFIILLIVLLTFMILPSSVVATITLQNEDLQPITTPVFINIMQGQNNLFSGSVKSGDPIILKGISMGDNVTVTATLEGFILGGGNTFVVNARNLPLVLQFKKAIVLGTTTLRVVDKDNSTSIGNASVSIYDKSGNLVVSGLSDDSGIVSLTNVGLNEEATIKVKRDGYADYESTLILSANLGDILLYKSEIIDGQTSKVKFTIASLGEPIGNVTVTIYEYPSLKKIGEEVTDADGIALFMNVQRGAVISFVAKKEGFIVFDSNSRSMNRTVVAEQEDIFVNITSGGSSLKVVVKNIAGITLQNINVGIYTKDGLEIDSNKTDLLGLIVFNGIDVKKTVYLATNAEGYYPVAKRINIETTQEIEIILEEMKLSELATLDLFVRDVGNKAVANATVNIFLKENDDYLPLKLEKSATDGSGYISVKLKPNMFLRVNAYNGNLEGTLDLNVSKGRNEFEMFLEPAGGLIRINVYDALNNLMPGVTLTAKSKIDDVVFSGTVNENGFIEGFSQGNSELIIEIIDTQGNLYSKVVQVKKIIDVKFSKSDAVENPKISFVGVYDGQNELVNSIQPGRNYWVKFRVAWPSFLGVGGVHIRLGDNGVVSTSQDYGILMAEAPGVASYKYGTQYNPTTSDGTPKDYITLGRAGAMNKWVELNYNAPVGASEIRVKLNVTENTDANEIPFYYRAWIVKDELYLRDPEDSVLNTSESITSKHMLYAETYDKEIKIMPNAMSCTETFCVSYVFRDDLASYDPFYPITDSVYALDLEFLALNNSVINLNLTTNKNTKNLYFNNYEFDSQEFKPKDEQHYDVEIKGLSLIQGERKKVRAYFTTAATGSTFLKFNITGTSTLAKTFDFVISDKRDFTISITDNGLINVGKDIYVLLRDSQGFITNANIYVIDGRGATAFYAKGDNKENNGFAGNYLIGGLPSGEYKLVVKAPGYITRELGFIVTRIGLLEAPAEVEVKIPKGSKSIRYTIDISNKANYDVKGLQYKVLRDDSENFTYRLSFLKSYIVKKGKTSLIVELSSELEEVAYGDLDLVISGELDTKEIVRTITHLRFSNSTDYDSACLVVAPSELKINMPDYVNSSTDVEFLLENKCLFDLTIAPELVSRDGEDKKVSFAMRSISLKKGEKKTMTSKLVNQEERSADGSIADFFVNFKTTYFNKQIPTTIDIWKTANALVITTTPYVFIYGAGNAFLPLTITNAGNLPIKNVRIMQVNDSRLMLNGIPQLDGMVPAAYSSGYSVPQNTSTYDARYLDYLNQTPYQETGNLGYSAALQNFDNYLEIKYPYLLTVDPYTGQYVNNLPLQTVNPYTGQYTTASGNQPVIDPLTGRYVNTYPNQQTQYGSNYPGQYSQYTQQIDPYTGRYVQAQNPAAQYYANNLPVNQSLSQYMASPVQFMSRVNHSFIFRPNTIVQLNPGQSQYVQVLITSNTQRMSGTMNYGLVATGTIDGARKTLQGSSMITVYSSGDTCFKILNVDQTTATTYTFTSNRMGVDFNPKRIKVINQCVEPVKIMGLTTQSIGGNPVSLAGADIVLPGQTAELYLGGRAQQNSEGTPTNIAILAATMQSQKPIVLPILVSFYVGQSATTVQGTQDPLQKRQGLICDGTESKTVYFPKISSTGDCGSGYCDGETLSNYILAKVKAYRESYDAKVVRMGINRASVPCGQYENYCLFEDLGVSNHNFTVYLMNDKISDPYLDKKLSEMNIGLKVANLYDADIDIKQVSGAKILYLPNAINRCGKYELELEGASLMLAGVLQRDTYSIKAKLIRYEPTDECKVNIVNAAIFLPQDKSSNADNPYSFMLGFIDYKDAELKSMAEKLSTKLLGVLRLSSEKGNTLILQKGETNVGSNVDVSITGSDPTNVVITATINRNLSITNQSIQTDIMDAIAGYFTGKFRGCINGDGTIARISSAERTQEGSFKIEGCDTINIFKGTPVCTFKITTSGISGAVDVVLSGTSESNGFTAQVLENGNPISDTVSLTASRSQGVMKKELALALTVTDVANAIAYSRDEKLTITLRNPEDDSELISKTVNLSACGIDPDTFVLNVLKERANAEQREFWAVTKWQEAGNSKLICDVLAKHKDFKDGGKDYSLASTQCTNLYSAQKATDRVTNNMSLSIGAASLAAGAACVATEALTGKAIVLGPFSALGTGISCGLALADLAGTSFYQMHRMRVVAGIDQRNWTDAAHDWMANTRGFNLLVNNYDQIDPATAMQEHHSLSNPFSSAVGGVGLPSEMDDTAIRESTVIGAEGALVGGARTGLTAQAVKLTRAYVNALAEFGSANPTQATSFAQLAKAADASSPAIKALGENARAAAKTAGLEFERLVNQAVLQESLGGAVGNAAAQRTGAAGQTAVADAERALANAQAEATRLRTFAASLPNDGSAATTNARAAAAAAIQNVDVAQQALDNARAAVQGAGAANVAGQTVTNSSVAEVRAISDSYKSVLTNLSEHARLHGALSTNPALFDSLRVAGGCISGQCTFTLSRLTTKYVLKMTVQEAEEMFGAQIFQRMGASGQIVRDTFVGQIRSSLRLSEIFSITRNVATPPAPVQIFRGNLASAIVNGETQLTQLGARIGSYVATNADDVTARALSAQITSTSATINGALRPAAPLPPGSTFNIQTDAIANAIGQKTVTRAGMQGTALGELANWEARHGSSLLTTGTTAGTTATTRATTPGQPQINNARQSAEEIAKQSVGSRWGSRIWEFGKGMFRGMLSYTAAALAYKAAFTYGMDNAQYTNSIIWVSLNNVESFVKYEPYSMKYENVGESRLNLIISGDSKGKNLSENCSINPNALSHSSNLSANARYSGTDEQLISRMREGLSSATAENMTPHMTEFNDAYAKANSQSEKALFLALINKESNFRMSPGSGGRAFGVMQLEEIACVEAGRRTNYRVEDCENDLKKNIESGIVIYNQNYNIMQSYLSQKGITDKKAIEVFALYAYNRGQNVSKKAVDLWKGNTEIIQSFTQACRAVYPQDSAHANTCPDGYNYPLEIYGAYLYLVGQTESPESGEASITRHMNSLIEPSATS